MKKLCVLLAVLLLAGCSLNSSAPVEENDLNKILKNMTLEEKVAQMFITSYPAPKDTTPGGYIFFANDFKNSDASSFKALVEKEQASAKIPLFMGVDEEGGTVNRVSKFNQFRDTPFLSPQDLYKNGGLDAIAKDTAEKSNLLKDLGLNLNFAPVCDVSTSQKDFMYKRSFGQNAQKTSEYVTTVTEKMNDAKIGSVLKHFPGYGSCGDTHTQIIRDSRPYSQFKSTDFLPFSAGILAGGGMVLVAHNIVECMDADVPASISPEVHRILRQELGFDGIIITDDMAMSGIADFCGDSDAAVLAVKAGNDMLCSTVCAKQISAVIDAVKAGEISEDRIDKSVIRILTYKRFLGLI